MPRKGTVLVILLLATPAAASDKLIFSYPCKFKYGNNQPCEEPPKGYQCDFARTMLRDDAAAYFNNLPSLAAQKEFLLDIKGQADDAYARYAHGTTDLLGETDPSDLPANLTPAGRLQELQALHRKLVEGAFSLSHNFLWEQFTEPSYIEKTRASWPESWKLYLEPFRDRLEEIEQLERQAKAEVLNASAASIEGRLKTIQTALNQNKSESNPNNLNQFFDKSNGNPRGMEALSTNDAAMPSPTTIRGPGNRHDRRLDVAVPSPDFARKTSVPHSSAIAADQGNYFARGVMPGLKRLEEEGMLTLWHAMGLTQTVGDPANKASRTVYQKGPSCVIGAQYEALLDHGIHTDIAKLTQEAYQKGYYQEYALKSGERDGGTHINYLNSLLTDHGVPTRIIDEGTPVQIVESIRSGGGAIVRVKTDRFWNDPSHSGFHAVYVTGAEINRATGDIIGFYVNDTGTGEGARYIPADEFANAWTRLLIAFAPPVPQTAMMTSAHKSPH